MDREKIHKVLDAAMDNMSEVTDVLANVVNDTMEAIDKMEVPTAKSTPNKFYLGQTVSYGRKSPHTYVITGVRITRSKKILYTLTDDYDTVVKDAEEVNISA